VEGYCFRSWTECYNYAGKLGCTSQRLKERNLVFAHAKSIGQLNEVLEINTDRSEQVIATYVVYYHIHNPGK